LHRLAGGKQIGTRSSIVLAFALVVGACSGGDPTTFPDAATVPESASSSPAPVGIQTSVSPAATASDSIEGQLGGEGGVAALLLGLITGYSIYQIAVNLVGLQSDGSLSDSDGTEIIPAGPPVELDIASYVAAVESGQALGVKSLRSAAQVNPMEALFGPFFPIATGDAVKAVAEEASVNQVDPALREEAAAIRLIIGLASRGYTPKQIIEAVIFDEVQSFFVTATDASTVWQECWSVVDQEGRILEPAGAPLSVQISGAPVVARCPSIDEEAGTREGRVAADTSTSAASGPGILAVVSITQGSGDGAVVIELFLELCPDGSLDVNGTVTEGGTGSISLRSGSWDPATGQGSMVVINEGPDFSVDSNVDLIVGDGFVEFGDGTVLQMVGAADCG